MEITCFIFVAYVLVMPAAIAELSSKQYSLKNKKYVVKALNENIKNKKNEYLKNTKLASFKTSEDNTEDQKANNIGKDDFFYRLKDSDFELIFRIKPDDFFGYVDATIRLFYYKKVPIIKHEDQFKKIAIKELEKREHVEVLPGGFFVDTRHEYLAAEPDGLIGNDSIVLIKFPDSPKKEVYVNIRKYNAYRKRISEIDLSKVTLDYRYQIQGQLHITKRMYCHYVRWRANETSVSIIKRDDAFWKNNMELKLIKFYNKFILQEKLAPRFDYYVL